MFLYLFSFYIKFALPKVEQRTCIGTLMDRKNYNILARFFVQDDKKLYWRVSSNEKKY